MFKQLQGQHAGVERVRWGETAVNDIKDLTGSRVGVCEQGSRLCGTTQTTADSDFHWLWWELLQGLKLRSAIIWAKFYILWPLCGSNTGSRRKQGQRWLVSSSNPERKWWWLGPESSRTDEKWSYLDIFWKETQESALMDWMECERNREMKGDSQIFGLKY